MIPVLRDIIEILYQYDRIREAKNLDENESVEWKMKGNI